MPNPPDPNHQPIVLDEDLYRLRLHELERERNQLAKQDGRGVTNDELIADMRNAYEQAYASPFTSAATAMIRGDDGPAEALCSRARADEGDAAADQLMTRIRSAVSEKRALLAESAESRRRRNAHRRPY